LVLQKFFQSPNLDDNNNGPLFALSSNKSTSLIFYNEAYAMITSSAVLRIYDVYLSFISNFRAFAIRLIFVPAISAAVAV